MTEPTEEPDYKAKFEELQREMESLKKLLLAKGEEKKRFRATHPAVILDQNTDYESWKKLVFNELQSMHLKWLVDSQEPKPDLTEAEIQEQTAYVNTYLLTRLSDEYKRATNELSLPIQILEKLEKLRYPQVPSATFDLHRQWMNMCYAKGKESAQQFIDRFDQMVVKLRKVGKVDDDMVVGNFVAAIKPYVREVVHRYDAANGKLTIEELRILLLNEEASEEESKKRTGEGEPQAAMMADEKVIEQKGEKRKTPDSQVRARQTKTCLRCMATGHVSQECTSDYFVCWNCKCKTKNPDHNSKTCWRPFVPGPPVYGNARRPSYRSRRGAGCSFTRGQPVRGGRGRGENPARGKNVLKRVKINHDGREKFVYVAQEDVAFFADQDPQAQVFNAEDEADSIWN